MPFNNERKDTEAKVEVILTLVPEKVKTLITNAQKK